MFHVCGEILLCIIQIDKQRRSPKLSGGVFKCSEYCVMEFRPLSKGHEKRNARVDVCERNEIQLSQCTGRVERAGDVGAWNSARGGVASGTTVWCPRHLSELTRCTCDQIPSEMAGVRVSMHFKCCPDSVGMDMVEGRMPLVGAANLGIMGHRM